MGNTVGRVGQEPRPLRQQCRIKAGIPHSSHCPRSGRVPTPASPRCPRSNTLTTHNVCAEWDTVPKVVRIQIFDALVAMTLFSISTRGLGHEHAGIEDCSD